MILDQFVLGGSNGEYPISDFKLELNYDRASELQVTMDAQMTNEIKNETFLRLYYLDKLVFEGIPYFANRDGESLELRIYDKNASLWIAGGFATVDSSGIIEFKDEYVYEIVKSVLAGSQFNVTVNSVPNRKISVSGNWQSKSDFMYAIAKQCMDEFGNTCTMWVDNKNVVNIGSRNSDITVDLSNVTSGLGREDINLINFGGAIIQGGEDDTGSKVLETSHDSSIYTNYSLRTKSLSNFNVTYTPANNKNLMKVSINNSDCAVRIGFDKQSSPILKYMGSPNSEEVRRGNSYSCKAMLVDKSSILEYEECDIVFEVKLDRSGDTSIENWYPYYPCNVYEGWGLPYTFIHNASVGLLNSEGEILVSVTIERFDNNIQFYKPSQYSTIGRRLVDEGKIRFFVNYENPNEAIGYTNPEPYDFVYNHYKTHSFLIWFSRRYGAAGNEWKLKVIAKKDTSWLFKVGEGVNDPDDALFDGTVLYANNIPSDTLIAGGTPFIKSELQTNVDTYFKDAAWIIKQIQTPNYDIPMFIGNPQKSIQHKPYLFYSDTNVKYKSQAQTLAKNLYSDYSKILTADIEIDPMAFYYPTGNKIDVGCIAEFNSPAPITGKYRIKSITATPSNVSVSLQNRSLNVNDVVDRLQKQIKDIGAT
jgi:hypothetical protein